MEDGEAMGIKVLCRIRQYEDEYTVMKVDQQSTEGEWVSVDQRSFCVHRVLEGPIQETVLDSFSADLFAAILSGRCCSVISYGQTGSGKTYTMFGNENLFSEGYEQDDMDSPMNGILPRFIQSVFSELQNLSVEVSVLEIYMENIKDLLDVDVSKNIRLNQCGDEVQIQNLRVEIHTEANPCWSEIRSALCNRTIGDTNVNEYSSRSHTAVKLLLRWRNEERSNKSSDIWFVDLAGSEKVSRTGAVGKRLDEAKLINKSLTAMGKVVNALVTGKSHIPYRDAKLTRILSNSLGGQSLTFLVITVTNRVCDSAESISTLLFGQNAQKIRTKAVEIRKDSVSDLQRKLNTYSELLKESKAYAYKLESILKANRIPYRDILNNEIASNSCAGVDQCKCAFFPNDQSKIQGSTEPDLTVENIPNMDIVPRDAIKSMREVQLADDLGGGGAGFNMTENREGGSYGTTAEDLPATETTPVDTQKLDETSDLRVEPLPLSDIFTSKQTDQLPIPSDEDLFKLSSIHTSDESKSPLSGNAVFAGGVSTRKGWHNGPDMAGDIFGSTPFDGGVGSRSPEDMSSKSSIHVCRSNIFGGSPLMDTNIYDTPMMVTAESHDANVLATIREKERDLKLREDELREFEQEMEDMVHNILSLQEQLQARESQLKDLRRKASEGRKEGSYKGVPIEDVVHMLEKENASLRLERDLYRESFNSVKTTQRS